MGQKELWMENICHVPKRCSESSGSVSKQVFIHGRFFGVVGALVRNLTKLFCLSLFIQIKEYT
jgi:hypothetical protein